MAVGGDWEMAGGRGEATVSGFGHAQRSHSVSLLLTNTPEGECNRGEGRRGSESFSGSFLSFLFSYLVGGFFFSGFCVLQREGRRQVAGVQWRWRFLIFVAGASKCRTRKRKIQPGKHHPNKGRRGSVRRGVKTSSWRGRGVAHRSVKQTARSRSPLDL